MNTFKHRISIFFFIVMSTNFVSAQSLKVEFNKGFELLDSNKIDEAKNQFRKIIELDSNEYGGYNFIGICFFKNKEFDSTIYYLQKSINRNIKNYNHSREMTIVRLCRTYLYRMDFKSAFDLAFNAYKEFPENTNIRRELMDICSWAYCIHHENLDSSYLSNEPKKEYNVTTIEQEYLIMKNLKVDDHNLSLMSQSADFKNKYDYLKCMINKTNDSIELKFKLNWNLNKEFGGKAYDSNKVYKNNSLPIWDRLGAKLSDDKQIDLLVEVEKLQKK